MEHEKNIREEMRKIFEENEKNKDRVDISLREYEELKNKKFILQNRIDRLVEIIEKLGIPTDMLDSINVGSITSFSEEIRVIGKRKHRIEFYSDLNK